MGLPLVLSGVEAFIRMGGVRRRRLTLSEGHVVSYLEAGARREGPTLVLVHGLGSSSFSYVRVIRRLARHHRVVAPDLPGYGKSRLDARQRALDVRGLTRALVEFLRSPACPGPVVLVGQSMGGWISVRAAHEAPERVEQLVLVNTAGVLYEGIEQMRHDLAPRTKEEVDALWRRLWHRVPFYYRPFWRASAAHLATAPVQGFMDSIQEGDFINGDLGRLAMPVSVIWGRSDRLIPPATVDALVDGLGSTRVFWLARCGHIPPAEQPREFTRILRSVVEAPPEERPLPPVQARRRATGS